jgi:uncharacterized membrane protein
MKHKIFMASCIIGMVSNIISMIFASAAKQYTAAIYHLLLFVVVAFVCSVAKEDDR